MLHSREGSSALLWTTQHLQAAFPAVACRHGLPVCKHRDKTCTCTKTVHIPTHHPEIQTLKLACKLSDFQTHTHYAKKFISQAWLSAVHTTGSLGSMYGSSWQNDASMASLRSKGSSLDTSL